MIAIDNTLEILEETSTKCATGCGREATWSADVIITAGDRTPMCAWCLMYSGHSKWAERNKHDLLHVGRACQEVAARSKKPVVPLDERGRIGPEEAERFMLGVQFTTTILSTRQLLGEDE